MKRMEQLLEPGLHSRSGIVRKGTAFILRGPKRLALAAATAEGYRACPPVIANSFPKSGTHLLDQIVAGLPGRRNFGSFIASLASSFQMRARSIPEAVGLIGRSVPGELVRGHLYCEPEYAAAFNELNFVHYFIYRDPRDVIISSCHYLKNMNRWHRLHRYFKNCGTLEEAILLSIRGLQHQDPTIPMPSVAERFAPYEGWINCPAACTVRFEDLRSEKLEENLTRMLDAYIARSGNPVAREATLDAIRAGIAPEKSHTFRKGKGGGWREAFTPRCRDAFKEVAGDLLVRLGYEANHQW